MIITKKHLPRRTVLRGFGATIALPFLDGMVPALAAIRNTAAEPVRRLGVFYVPMGMNMAKWTPAGDGRELELSPTLQSLAPFQDRLVLLGGLASQEATGNDNGPHPRAQAAWLTGARAKRTEGVDLHVGISMDQIAAQAFGHETQLASLELALEAVDTLNGGCASYGYSCVYTNTIAWRSATTPLPMEVNPRAVFERLFGIAESTDPQTRLARIRKDRSLLDAVNEKVASLQKQLGPRDRTKLTEYLEAVRDVERRVQKAEEQADQELPTVDRPGGIPATYEEHAKLMFDLLTLAYQSDLTRVSTFLYGREASVRTFPEIGIPDSWHPMSHHQDKPEALEKQAKLNSFHMELFAYFLEKLQSTDDGEGSLLDHTVLLYGSGMSNSNLHVYEDLPTLVVGGKAAGIKGNRHLRYPERTPIANLHLTLLDRVGVPEEQFGDSNGTLTTLSDV